MASYPIVIDTSVYKEVVAEGIAKNYPDAFVAQKFLSDYKIEIIPIDISDDLPLFRDPGETSCYLLAKDNGVCLTSDRKAISKMIKYGQEPISLDEYFYNMCKHNYINIEELQTILIKFIGVFASTEKRRQKFLDRLGDDN